MKFLNKLRQESLASRTIFCILLASLIAPAAHATRLGRLFFTPEQRTQLEYDYARTTAVGGDSSSVLMVNGIVQKHGGARTVWINGVPQKAGNSDERSPEALPIAVPGKSQPVKIKVGQKILLDQPAQQNPTAPNN